MSAHEPILPPAAVSQTSAAITHRGSMSSARSDVVKRRKTSAKLGQVGRRSLGIGLLLVTVFLWTGSNFLASNLFADDTYSKPYFITYLNTSVFAISLLPIFIKIAYQRQREGSSLKAALLEYWNGGLVFWKHDEESTGLSGVDDGDYDEPDASSHSRLLVDGDYDDDNTAAVASTGRRRRPSLLSGASSRAAEEMLSVKETAKLSLEFCMLWFLANYFAAGCLEHTSVSSATILTSTSSLWTLLLGALTGVERSSLRKLVGVLASVAGIAMISLVDLEGGNDEGRGNFPHKSRRQVAVGDAMACLSAVLYGVYTVVMKKRIGNEERVNMPLFFGMVGLFNVILLWPGFIILHFADVERFELPPTGRIWTIVCMNAFSSILSDYCWAYAMLLTTPLVVTVGLALTIPLSLIGQMIISSQYTTPAYWIGAVVVVLSFVFINNESHEEEPLVVGTDTERQRRTS